MEAHVTRSEVELLVIARVVRDVHLTILSCDGAVLFQYNSRIMIQSCGTTLKEGGDNHHAVLIGESSEEFRRRTRDGLCLIEHVDMLRLTKIQPIMQFL